MESQKPVFESNASYFNNTTKKWLSGIFTLNEKYLSFVGNYDQRMVLPLNTIAGLERRQSSFIYAALVVSVGSEKYWFASFQNRDTVYNLIELFWRESLLSKPYKSTSSQPSDANTALGRELLSLLHESESTLVASANALANQGRQLEESQVVVEDINSDLDVAEKFLKTMSLVSLTERMQSAESDLITTEKIKLEDQRQKHFKVTFTFSKWSNNSYQCEKGTLIIAENITLLDEHQNRRLLLINNEVEKIQVLSPWEFSLTYSSGWASKPCYITCPQLSSLLKFLNSFPSFKRRIASENDDPLYDMDSNCRTIVASTIRDTNCSSDCQGVPVTAQEQMQQKENTVISVEDMEEISNVLNSLQSLAAEVGNEQKDQFEKINRLLSDIDKTTLRLNADNITIKKAS